MGCTNHPTVVEGIVRCTRCHRQFCQDCVVVLRGFPYCGDCKGEQVRDIQSGGSAGALDLASIGARIGGFIIDYMVCVLGVCVLVFPLGILVGVLGAATKSDQQAFTVIAQMLSLPFSFLVPFLYEGLMVKARGQTLGKMALGMKVVTPEGNDVDASTAWKRAGVKAGIAMCCLFVDDLPACFDDEKMALHDRIAETRVVRV
jgi:uncharacterized RDD family membrane protein YckC